MNLDFAVRGARGRSLVLVSLLFTLPSLLPVVAQAQLARSTTLDPVIVTASRTAQPLDSVLADVSVVNRDAIEKSGAVAVADLLARLPGIEFARNGGPGTATSVFVRGAEARHVAVYIDGARVDSQSTGGAVWEQIPLEMIEHIEVVRGPAAAIYGSDAVAGVVQLFTRRGSGNARPTLAMTGGTYGTRIAQGGVSGAAGAFDYSLSAAHGRSDGFSARALPTANPDDDGWRRDSLQARVGYQFTEAQRVDASLLGSNLRSQYDSSPTADDTNRHTLRSANVAWQGCWSEESRTQFQFGRSRSTYETRPSFYRTETTLQNYALQHEQRVGAHVFTGIVERREDELVNPATAFAALLRGDRSQNAAGVGWRTTLGAHSLQANVRRDDDSEFGGKSTGSVAWGWRFLPALRATVAAATSFRVPTLYQRFSQYGNPSLEPESGRNVELGLRWSGQAGELSLTGWRNNVTNLISFGAPGPCVDSFGCYVNVGRARLEGATLAGRVRLGAVAVQGSVDFHAPTNADTGKILARRAKRFATVGAETTLAGWNLGGELQASGYRFDNAANTQRLGGYTLVNLYVARPLVSGLVFEARVDNLADRTYQLARTYATPGRSVQATLRWSLK
jgi:vitamin B12 transporter